jgi:hypothetical protein
VTGIQSTATRGYPLLVVEWNLQFDFGTMTHCTHGAPGWPGAVGIGSLRPLRWGERLEYVANVGPGDFVYFAPYVPHQERNPSAGDPVDFLVVRSDNERIVVALGTEPVEKPENMF